MPPTPEGKPTLPQGPGSSGKKKKNKNKRKSAGKEEKSPVTNNENGKEPPNKSETDTPPSNGNTPAKELQESPTVPKPEENQGPKENIGASGKKKKKKNKKRTARDEKSPTTAEANGKDSSNKSATEKPPSNSSNPAKQPEESTTKSTPEEKQGPPKDTGSNGKKAKKNKKNAANDEKIPVKDKGIGKDSHDKSEIEKVPSNGSAPAKQLQESPTVPKPEENQGPKEDAGSSGKKKRKKNKKNGASDEKSPITKEESSKEDTPETVNPPSNGSAPVKQPVDAEKESVNAAEESVTALTRSEKRAAKRKRQKEKKEMTNGSSPTDEEGESKENNEKAPEKSQNGNHKQGTPFKQPTQEEKKRRAQLAAEIRAESRRKKKERKRNQSSTTGNNNEAATKQANNNPLLEAYQAFMQNNASKQECANFFSTTLMDADRRAELWTEQADLGEALLNQYSWAIPDERAIRILKHFSPLVEIGCGANAYWARLLKREGVDIIAYDVNPNSGGKIPTEGHQQGTNGSESKDELQALKGGPEALAFKKVRKSKRTLLLCYCDEEPLPPEVKPTDQSLSSDERKSGDSHKDDASDRDGGSLGAACLRHYQGDYIIHIGELYGDTLCVDQAPWGRTSAPTFQELLAKSFHCLLKASLPSWLHTRDSISVWKRTETCPMVFAGDNEDDEPEEDHYRHIPSEERLQSDIAAQCLLHLLHPPTTNKFAANGQKMNGTKNKATKAPASEEPKSKKMKLKGKGKEHEPTDNKQQGSRQKDETCDPISESSNGSSNGGVPNNKKSSKHNNKQQDTIEETPKESEGNAKREIAPDTEKIEMEESSNGKDAGFIEVKGKRRREKKAKKIPAQKFSPGKDTPMSGLGKRKAKPDQPGSREKRQKNVRFEGNASKEAVPNEGSKYEVEW
ncbi:expressed unknown protein [Seminavis robusta]|uniref:Uncharacterized protein n=1 Tax=Seminavis robusta TaxID=568900 RepID=A0A9N8DKN5_9STRA|nr:expressed unknown protein [Seminavis robusta]|eukprot:Sro207_g086870.1 n/a (908) ;mRNA; r:48807-51530